ncbi:MAG: 3-deoxy-manno-octulosonate cytidylyltransferase [Candidatus Brocadiaceae bacterium]|nr:3-deoxy-manno-octulosonate cytidylyltransferase [Candidatus Brocadiaceae bacterium]
MKVVAIIPARMGSTRFHGKPLAKIHGHSMIEHVYRRVLCSKLINELYVATCDKEIADEVKRFKGRAIMTSPHHLRGTDRVAEAIAKIEADIVINVQGDEPMVDPNVLDKAIAFINEQEDIQCVNLISPINEWDCFVSKDVVKTVLDKNNKVLYFSRQPIPTCKPQNFKNAFKQIGIYIFRKEFLLQFSQWPETSLEQMEQVDMLRIIENGFPIYTFESNDMIGVDKPGEVALVEQALLNDPLYQKLFTTNSPSA